ncbi:MAG TPA: hypothetical protein VIM53_00985 [Candidatus Saccharimonadales bacterium]
MKQKSPVRRVGFVVAAVVGVILALNYIRPLPTITAAAASLSTRLGAPTLDWPTAGQSAVGAVGYGVLDDSGEQSQLATASVAKIITALTVLKVKPLSAGSQGPEITITADDVALYNKYVAEDGSVVQVTQGEQISEYQALQAMLLPSGNNIADMLATWAYGSMDSYKTAANNYINSIGMTGTNIGSDASGYSPDTTSTAPDLVRLGEAAMQNPVVAEIVGQKSAVLPGVGTVYNVDTIIGQDGIVGIKTGNNDQDTGVFLFAAKHTLSNNQTVTIVGTVMGQGSLQGAFDASEALLDSAAAAFSVETPVAANQTLVTYTVPWMKTTVNGVAKTPVSIAAWQGSVTLPHLSLPTVSGGQSAGATVGTVSVSAGANNASSSIVLKDAIPSPSFWWRLTRF